MNETRWAVTDRKQGLVDLLTRIGDAKIGFQNLDQCMRGAQTLKRGQTEIRFGTQAITAADIATDGGPMGLVLWLDRGDVQAAREAFQAESDGAETPRG